MAHRRHRADPPQDPSSQLLIAFAPRRALDQRQRADAVALLSQLLLQVVSAQRHDEVHDDRS